MSAEREISSLASKAEIASNCMPLGLLRHHRRPLRVNHTGGPETVPARLHFLRHGIHENDINQFLTPTGLLLESGKKDPIKNPYELLPEAVGKYLKTKLHPFYNINNRSIEGVFQDGYNNHDQQHAEDVEWYAGHLLRLKKAPDDVVRRGVIMAWGHDLGNTLSRVAHPFLSVALLRHFVPNLLKDPDQWRIIQRGIKMHDTEFLRVVTNSWGDLPSEERFKKMREFLGDEGLALFIADKVDVGPARLSRRYVRLGDSHAEINLLARTDRKHLRIVGGKTFTWEMEFVKTPTEQDLQEYPHIARVIKAQRDAGVEPVQLNILEGMFWEVYTERNIAAVEAIFALYPQVQAVEVNMHDYSDFDTKGKKFTREHLDEQIKTLRERIVQGKMVQGVLMENTA